MSGLDFTYVLWYSQQNPNDPYWIQISTTHGSNTYGSGVFTIKSQPIEEEGTLEIDIRLEEGDDSPLIQDIDLGVALSFDPHWQIEVNYFDSNGTFIEKKKKNSEQAEIEARPRPTKDFALDA